MKKYIANIKEKMNDSILKPTYMCESTLTKEFLIKFWGLNEPDIEWFRIYEVIEDENGNEVNKIM